MRNGLLVFSGGFVKNDSFDWCQRCLERDLTKKVAAGRSCSGLDWL